MRGGARGRGSVGWGVAKKKAKKEDAPGWSLSAEAVEWWWSQGPSEARWASGVLAMHVQGLDLSTAQQLPKPEPQEPMGAWELSFLERYCTPPDPEIAAAEGLAYPTPSDILSFLLDCSPGSMVGKELAAVQAILLFSERAQGESFRRAVLGPRANDPVLAMVYDPSVLQHVIKAEVGRRVKEAREAMGLGQVAFAESCGKSRAWIAKVESGENAAQLWLLVHMAKATKRSVGWFFGDYGKEEGLLGGALPFLGRALRQGADVNSDLSAANLSLLMLADRLERRDRPSR